MNPTISFKEGKIWLTRGGERARILVIRDETWTHPITASVPSIGILTFDREGRSGPGLPQYDLIEEAPGE